jgi:hypothetical protein
MRNNQVMLFDFTRNQRENKAGVRWLIILPCQPDRKPVWQITTPFSLFKSAAGVEKIMNELERIGHETFIAGVVF